MKFGKKYTTFMEREAQQFLPEYSYVEFKRLKKLLKNCPHHDDPNVASSSPRPLPNYPCQTDSDGHACRLTDNKNIVETEKSTCGACDAQFFSELSKAASSVADCFSSTSRQLRSLHLASGPRRLFLRLKTKISTDTPNMIRFGNILVSYGCMNALAVRKILKKYDKVHGSLNGRAFQTNLQAMRAELLQSPWLIELGALAINLMEPRVPRAVGPADISSQADQLDWSCNLDCEKHTLSCVLPDTVQLEYNLQCSICLDIVFDPVALGCGHIFCRSCVCAAASVPTFQGVKAARRGAKCPLCRQAGVYAYAIHMDELAVLIRVRCEEYFHDRKLVEREQRLKEAKEYWERETMAIMGL